jgi:hypothetical protein
MGGEALSIVEHGDSWPTSSHNDAAVSVAGLHSRCGQGLTAVPVGGAANNSTAGSSCRLIGRARFCS